MFDIKKAIVRSLVELIGLAMKVSKAQAKANRAHVVETASALFREHGYDGVGVADLMAQAGFTHGGFYKQFRSKAELMVEAAACGIAKTVEQTAGVELLEFVQLYLSRTHRDQRASGCTMAALGSDAARQPKAVGATFAAGVEQLLAALKTEHTPLVDMDAAQKRARLLNLLANVVGAIVISRACPDDSPLADEILSSCRDQILATLAPAPLTGGAP